MRITFVLPYADLSGGIKVVAIYADRLSRRGHAVHVVSLPPRSPGLREGLRNLVRLGRWRTSPPLPHTHFDGLPVAHRILESHRPVAAGDVPEADVVVATWWKTAGWVAGFPPSRGVQAILIQGYEVPPGTQNPDVDAAWRLPLRKIVIAKWLRRLAAEKFGDAGALLVPNGVDPAQFHAPPREKGARPTLGFLYSTSPYKGLDVTLRAVDLVRRRVPSLRVVAFGTERPAPERPLPEGAEYHRLPAQDAIRAVYAACDVWLCGSRREGFHLPPLEAMACRCPVVSTRVGGPDEIVEEGVNGRLVEPEDAEGLARGAAGILEADPAAWRRMSDAALRTAEAYTWERSTAALEEALRTVAAAGGAA